jgi:dienelactone hydrolase
LTAGTFAEAEGRVLTLHGAGDYEGAIEMARAVAVEWPDRVAYTAFWIACFLALQGDADGAAAALENALRTSAVWWSPELLANDEDLSDLQHRADFAAVLEESARRADAARVNARVEWEVIEPVPSEHDALLVALHGRTGNLADSGEHWRVAAEAGVRTVVVQSSQMVGAGMHCWDDLSVAVRDVDEAIREATAGETPRDGIVLAGFSQGGGVATRMAVAQEPVAAAGVIGVCPSFGRAGVTPQDLAPFLPGAAREEISAWIVVGENDTNYRAAAEQVANQMAEAGIVVSLTVNAGLGHEFAPDFGASLTDMLAQVASRR